MAVFCYPNIMKPKILHPGDTVLLISPASGAAGVGVLKHRVENGKTALEQMQFKVIIAEHALVPGERAGTGEERAQDINKAFQDENIKALISMIGGNHVCAEVLPYLDYEAIKNNPKIIMGYSDVTSLLLGIYKNTGMTVFYGPAVMTQFGEFPTILPYTKKWFEKVLMSSDAIGKIEPSPEWTDETLDWAQKLDLTRPRKLLQSNGWEWLSEGKAQGKLIGGCIQTLVYTIESYPDYIPDFAGSMFFWESCESGLGVGHSPQEVKQDLIKLKDYGIFEKMSGMVIGRPYAYNDVWHEELKEIITEIVGTSKPILYNVEFGHTDPIITVPIGAMATIDSVSNLFSIDESAVE